RRAACQDRATGRLRPAHQPFPSDAAGHARRGTHGNRWALAPGTDRPARYLVETAGWAGRTLVRSIRGGVTDLARVTLPRYDGMPRHRKPVHTGTRCTFVFVIPCVTSDRVPFARVQGAESGGTATTITISGSLRPGRYQQTEHQTRWRRQPSRPRRELRLSARRYTTRTSAYRDDAVTPERRQQIFGDLELFEPKTMRLMQNPA